MIKTHSLSDLGTLVKKYSNVIVVADKNSAKYTLPLLELPKVQTLLIDGREQCKNIDTVVEIWKKFEALHLDRNSVAVNLGGGVVSDVSGFAASTYKRGIPYINVPTTLLAMVDASIGGKTAVNVDGIKNLAGLFALPAAVLIDIKFLDTLPLKEKMSGFAELIKMYAITKKTLDLTYLTYVISAFSGGDKMPLEEAILFSAKQKEKVVSKDFTEQGSRKILNFGHTVGHAIESLCLKKNIPLTHGEAVLWGMVAELYLSVKLLDFPMNEYNKFKAFAHEHYDIPQGILNKKDLPVLMSFIRNDKKNSGDKIYPVLLSHYGACRWDIPVSEEDVKDSIMQLILQEVYKRKLGCSLK
ncbi:MAG: 3-dehydroquinate synthase [Bacteroidales bacterium]|jgi:3-dehydroquinate synthase|nr:3-dehydroquinate synthase [Bacteroidales bacterium]